MSPDTVAQIVLAGITAASSLVAAAVALYVSLRLYKFKDELLKSINGTYVKSEVFKPWKQRVEEDVDLAFRKIDGVNKDIADVRVDVGRLEG